MNEQGEIMFKDVFESSKEKLMESVDKYGPGIFEAFHDQEGKYRIKRVEDMANFIAGNCHGFSPDERRFVSLFIKTIVGSLQEVYLKKDFTIDAIHRIIDCVDDVNDDVRCTCEFLLERSLESNKNMSKNQVHNICELLRMFDAKHVGTNFKEMMHEQVNRWKDECLDDLLQDDDYRDYCLKMVEMHKVLERRRFSYETKVFEHFASEGLFKLKKTVRYNENPKYDYDELDGTLVRFRVNPTICEHAILYLYKNGLEEEPNDWYTTNIVERTFLKKEFVLRTLNTAYYFEIVNPDELNQ